MVRCYRQVRYVRASAPCRLQQSFWSHQPRSAHCETIWHGPACTSCNVDGSVPARPSTVVNISDTVSNIGYPDGGVPQGTLSGPKNVLVQINDLQTPCPIFKYVDDSTVFDVCNNTSVPMLQESADIITDWSRHNDMRLKARKAK